MIKYRIELEGGGYTEQFEKPDVPHLVIQSKFYVGRTLDWLIGRKEFDFPDEAKEYALNHDGMDRFEEEESVVSEK